MSESTLERFEFDFMANHNASQLHYWLLMLVKLCMRFNRYEVEYDATDRGGSDSRSQRVKF